MAVFQKVGNAIRTYPVELGAAVLASIAVIMAGFAFAATYAGNLFAYADASQASGVSGGASVITDATAASGKALKFGAATTNPPTNPPTSGTDLNDAKKRDMAFQIVSAAENSSLDWKAQYSYIEYNVECYSKPEGQRENCGNSDNRGYTGGIIGFTSRYVDMLDLLKYYKQIAPGNVLEKYIPTLESKVASDSSSSSGLGTAFMNDWKAAANNADGKFKQAQDRERDRVYFNPSVNMAKQDGVRALGQFIYYDAGVMHSVEAWGGGLPDIRAVALKKAKPPAQGGDEKTWLNAFLDARKAEMLKEEGHSETGRVDNAQRKFLNEGNFDFNAPLTFGPIYEGDSVFTIK